MIARLDQTYYFAEYLGQKRTIYFILTKKLLANGTRKLRKTDSLCGLYAIYSALLLSKFYQRNLKNIHDVRVLKFICNFM